MVKDNKEDKYHYFNKDWKYHDLLVEFLEGILNNEFKTSDFVYKHRETFKNMKQTEIEVFILYDAVSQKYPKFVRDLLNNNDAAFAVLRMMFFVWGVRATLHNNAIDSEPVFVDARGTISNN